MFGIRKPNLMRMLKARTIGRLKRKILNFVRNLLYPNRRKRRRLTIGEKVEQSVKRRVYRKTTFSVWDILKKMK